ncbi:hypothetical protein LZ30DRAFT_686064 [Colletotrichum cereale]|nr:hypothetical protein LZ30DRAFT_686064 [Colletotrichum cereale]
MPTYPGRTGKSWGKNWTTAPASLAPHSPAFPRLASPFTLLKLSPTGNPQNPEEKQREAEEGREPESQTIRSTYRWSRLRRGIHLVRIGSSMPEETYTTSFGPVSWTFAIPRALVTRGRPHTADCKRNADAEPPNDPFFESNDFGLAQTRSAVRACRRAVQARRLPLGLSATSLFLLMFRCPGYGRDDCCSLLLGLCGYCRPSRRQCQGQDYTEYLTPDGSSRQRRSGVIADGNALLVEQQGEHDRDRLQGTIRHSNTSIRSAMRDSAVNYVARNSQLALTDHPVHRHQGRGHEFRRTSHKRGHLGAGGGETLSGLYAPCTVDCPDWLWLQHGVTYIVQ